MRILSLVLLAAGTCVAAPFVPADPKEVLETLPVASADRFSRELRQLRLELASDPRNLELATRAARGYIQRARAEADPRYLGYAQAALAPWWDAGAPASVLVLRATIRQSLHDFPNALADLSAALKIEPRNAQAWLTRATIQQVRGAFGEAMESCRPLERLAGELVATACWAGGASMSGQAEASYERLRDALARQRGASPGVRQWVLVRRRQVRDAARGGRRDQVRARTARRRRRRRVGSRPWPGARSGGHGRFHLRRTPVGRAVRRCDVQARNMIGGCRRSSFRASFSPTTTATDMGPLHDWSAACVSDRNRLETAANRG